MSGEGIARAGRAAIGRELLRRADAAVRDARELYGRAFWVRREMRLYRAGRLSEAAERLALAADRRG